MAQFVEDAASHGNTFVPNYPPINEKAAKTSARSYASTIALRQDLGASSF